MLLLEKLKALFNRQMEKAVEFASVREAVQTVKKEVAMATDTEDTEDTDTDDENFLVFKREVELAKAKKERDQEEKSLLELVELAGMKTAKEIMELLTTIFEYEETYKEKCEKLFREKCEIEKLEQLNEESRAIFKELKRMARPVLAKVNADWRQSDLQLGKKVIESLEKFTRTSNDNLEVIRKITVHLEALQQMEKKDDIEPLQELEEDEWDLER